MEDQSDKAIDMKFLGMCGVSLDEVPLGLLAGPPAEAESQDELEDEPHAHETDQTEAHDEGSSFRDEHQDLISVEYELQPLPIPNPGPPPHHDRIRRFREDVIYYLLAQKNRNCLSDNMMKVIYEMGTAVTGGIPIVGIEEVEQLEDQLVNECLPISRFMCSCCKALLPTSTSDCTSLSCRSYTRRRNTCAETIVITTYDILPQLKSIVNEQFDDILQCHERVHSGWIFSQSDDLVNFPFFKEHMESQAEFTTNKLWLQGVINSDGFSFEGNFRGSFWPVTIAIADLRASIRFSPRHMFTAGFVRAPTKPPTKALHLLFDRLRSDLRTRFPVYMNRNGVVYEIRLTITFPSLDNEAAALLYEHPSYTKGLCHFCQNVAPYINKHYRYSTISGPRKDRQYVLTNAPRCDGGFRGYSVFNRIVPLDNSTIDWLHDSLEGVYKTLIKDIISGKKRRGIRVRPRVIKTIDELCGRILMPTYYPARLLPLTKYKTGSGSCIAVHVVVTVPLLSLTKSMADELHGAYTFLIVGVFRHLLDDNLTAANLNLIADLNERIAVLWESIFGQDSTTSKTHRLLAHLSTELRRRGHPLSYSTSGFEHNNLFLKQLLSPLNTAGFDHKSMNRFIIWQRCVAEIEKRAPDTTLAQLKRLAAKMLKTKRRCLLQGDEFSPSVRIDFSMKLDLSQRDPRRFLYNEVERRVPQCYQPLDFQ